MNHWLQLTPTPSPVRPSSTHPGKHKRQPSKKGKAVTRVRELVKRQPVDVWFSALDIFDGTVCSEDYVREILKGMAERGELVSEVQTVKREYATQVPQSRTKWMFKRIDRA